jgi:ribosomal protein S21
VFAQNQPVNFNYLIENGISPRVLDAAASSFMQDGRFAENVIVKVKNSEGEKYYDVDLIFDPMYNDGMDIRAVVNTKNIEKKDLKQLKKYLEKSHYFSRMSRKYLYDENTLKLVNKTGNNLELEYFYQTKDIDPYLNYIKKNKRKYLYKKRSIRQSSFN